MPITTADLLAAFPKGDAKTAVLIKVDGTLEVIAGECDGARLCALIVCQRFQMVPCTEGPFDTGYEIWCNEEGMYQDARNEHAMAALGNQVYDGTLHGNILLVQSGFVR